MRYNQNHRPEISISSKLNIAFPCLIFLYLIILYAPMFVNDGPLLRTDQPMWTSFAHVMKYEVVPDQKWFWNIITDRENAGQTMGGSYSFNLIVLWLFSNIFSPALSVKLFLFVCVLSFSISMYMVALKLTDPIIAVIIALLSIPFIFKNAADGMCYSHLSFSFGLFFWLSSLNFLNSFNAKYWLISVLLTTLTLYTHPIGFITCFIIWFALLISTLITRDRKSSNKALVFYLSIPFISFLLASPQIFATIYPRSSKGLLSTKSALTNNYDKITSDYSSSKITFDYSLRMRTYFPIGIGIGVMGKLFLGFWGLVGLIFSVKKENRLKLPLMFMFLATFLLASKILVLSPIKLSFLNSLTAFYWRFAFSLPVLSLFVVGIGLHAVCERFLRTSFKKRWIRLTSELCALFVIIAALGLCCRVLTNNRLYSPNLLMTFDEFAKKDEVISLWKWLAKNVNSEETRVYFEDTFYSYPSTSIRDLNHILALTSIATPIKQIGGWIASPSGFNRLYNAGHGGFLFGHKKPHDLTEDVVASKLKLLNCKYIVANSPDIILFLKNVSFLKQVAVIGAFTIFEYREMTPAWAFKKDTKEMVALKKISPSRYFLKTEGHKGELIHIALRYNSRWKGFYSNQEIPIINHKALMQIKLPVTGNQEIELKYTVDKKTPIILFSLGLAGLLFLGAVRLILYIKYKPSSIRHKV